MHCGSEEQLPLQGPEKSCPFPRLLRMQLPLLGGGGALGEGGRLPLLPWGGSEEQLLSTEPEESCSSPGSAMEAVSPACEAARSAREDGCPPHGDFVPK